MAVYKYNVIYKCPLCSTEFTVQEKPVEMDENMIPDMLAKVVKNQQMIGHPYLYVAPMHLPHKCGNGNGGLAQLIGFKRCN